MKNFKKLIATMLAVIMVATTAMTASAATVDFTDGSQVDYVEAVDIMTAIGVIHGNPDGSFNPSGDVSRAEMAKMVTFIMNEGEDVAGDFEGTNNFTDCGWHWAKGYIAYAANAGIVDGLGDGTFDPDGSVTGVEGAKMLLTALGYNSSYEGYLGTSWAVNVISDARSAGLMDDFPKGFNYNVAMSRDEAALMMFNALKSTMVDYSGTGGTITLPDGTTVTTGSPSAYDRTWSGTAGTNYETGKSSVKDETIELCEEYFSDLYISESSSDTVDLLGRDAHTWYYNRSVVGTYTSDADYSFTSTEEASDAADFTEAIEDAIDEDQDADIDPTLVILNGEEQIAFGAGQAELHLGDTVEVYVDDDNQVTKVVVIRYVYDTIDSIELEDDLDDCEIYTENGLTLTYDDTMNFQALLAAAEEDMAILVAGNAAAQYPSTATGDITAYKTGDYIVMDGTTYSITTDAYTTYSMGITEDGSESTIYIAENGYVVYAEDINSDGNDSTVVVTKSYAALNDDSEIVNMVRVVTSTGVVKALEVDQTYDAGKAYTYVENDDVYTLTEVATIADLSDADGQSTTFASTTVTSGSARLSVNVGESTESIYYSSDVVFVFVDTADDNEATVYEGVTEFDSAQSGVAVLEKVGTGTSASDYRVVAVYAIGDNAVAEGAETSSDDIFYMDGTKTGTTRVNGTTYYNYEVYVNGSLQSDIYATSENYTGGFFTAKINDDGAYTFTAFTSDSDYVAISGAFATNIDNRIITIDGSEEDFDVSSAKVVDLTDNSIKKIADLDTNATLSFIYDEDFVVEAVYVTAYSS